MDRIETLLDLLDRWDETPPRERSTPAQFCGEHPELLEDFSQLLRQRGVLTSLLNGEESPAMKPDAMIERLQGGRFPVVQFHDQGGLGWVYLANDRELGRTVALKCLQPEPSTDPLARQRFIREAEITAGLEHPGVVPIYGLGNYGLGNVPQQEFPSYAMRFIQGETLRDTIRSFHHSQSPVDWRSVGGIRILRAFVTVCETIAFAHSRGVIHRDLKSANVMLGDYGETLVLDWGLAKRLTDPSDVLHSTATLSGPTRHNGTHDLGATQMGTTLGTVGFMSPEQVNGNWDRVNIATDIFSLGAILYEVVTDQCPYSGDNAFEKAKRCSFLPPQAINPKTPRSLAAICLKAMSAEPSQRYGSASDLRADVELFLADEPVSARQESWIERTQRTLRKHRRIAQMGGLMTLATIIMLASFLSVTARKNKELEAAFSREETAKDDAIQQRNRVQEALIQSVHENYAARMAQVSQALSDRQPERLIDAVKRARPRVGSPIDPRGVEWWMSWEQALGKTHPIPIAGDKVAGMRLIDRGAKAIVWTDDRELLVIDTQSGHELFRDEVPQPSLAIWNHSPTDLPISADGSTLTIHVNAEIKIYSLLDGQYAHTKTLNNESRVFATSVSQDGTIVVAGNAEGVVRVWDLAREEMRSFNIGQGRAITRLTLSPDGRFLAYFANLSQGGLPTVLDLEEGNTISAPEEWKGEFGEIGFGQYDTLLAWNKDRVVTFAISFPNQLTKLWETSLSKYFEDDPSFGPSRSIREWITLTKEGATLDPATLRDRIHAGDLSGAVQSTTLAMMRPSKLMASEVDYRQIGFRLLYRELIPIPPGNAIPGGQSDGRFEVRELKLPNLESIIDFSADGDAALLRSVGRQYSTLMKEAWSWECIDRYAVPGAIGGIAWTDADDLISVTRPPFAELESTIEIDRSAPPYDQQSGMMHRTLTLSPGYRFSDDLSILASYRENHVNVELLSEPSRTFTFGFQSQTPSFVGDTSLVRVYPWPRYDLEIASKEPAEKSRKLGTPIANSINGARTSISLPWVLCVPKYDSDGRVDRADDKSVCSIVDYEESKIVHRFDVPDAAVLAVAISLDGRAIAMVSGDTLNFRSSKEPQRLHAWRIAEDRAITKLPVIEFRAAARRLAFNSARTHLAVGALDGQVIVVDLRSGAAVLRTNAHEGLVRAMAFAPDDSRLITAGEDKNIRFISTRDWQEVMQVTCPSTPTSLAMNRRSQRLAIGDEAGHIRILAASTTRDVLHLATQWLKEKSTAIAGEETVLGELWAEFVTTQGRSEDEVEAGEQALEALRGSVRELSFDELRRRFMVEAGRKASVRTRPSE